MAATICGAMAWEQFNYMRILILDTIKFYILYKYWPTPNVILAEFDDSFAAHF